MIASVGRRRPARARAGIAGACLVAAWLVAGLLSAAGAAGAIVVSNGSRARPVVALTFDDGISPANCRRILAILVEEGVPATFFPMAAAMPLDPAFWRLVVRAGDPVGDHTLTHPEMPTLSAAAQLGQISQGRSLGESILGRSMLRAFRPPSGAYDGRTIEAAAAAGFGTVLLWDTSDRDTSRAGTVAEMLAAGERGINGSVVLLHCGPNATPYVLRPLIASYRARGFGFVTVPKLLGVPWASGVTTPPSPAEILDGLSPLPPSPSGGPITGPNGYVPPSGPRPSVPTPSRSAPTASPGSAVPTATGPSATPTGSGASSSPVASGGLTPSPSASGLPDESPGPGAAAAAAGLWALALVPFAAGAGGLALLSRRRRRG